MSQPKQILTALACCMLWLIGTAQQTQYTDITEICGFSNHNRNHGVATADFDSDGWEDVYISVRSGYNRLYRNLGDGRYEDMSQSSGLDFRLGTRTAVWGDIDNDGDADLYLGNPTANDRLYRNLGNGKFEDITAKAGVINLGSTFSVNMNDVNNDGFLDIYVSNFLSENILWLNDADTTFSDVTGTYNARDQGRSMGAVYFDYDNDGDSDLYLVHDGDEPNTLYRNAGGVFEDVSAESNADFAGQGMGVDVADINNDGFLDVYICNLYENVLLLNNGDGTFEDISTHAGIRDYGMGWGVTFLDFDNDGWVDIYICNDSYFSPYPNVLYRNNGNLTFSKTDIGHAVSSEMASYGCVCSDMDMDGALDIIVANRGNNDYMQLFSNNGSGNHWVGFQLVGRNGNASAIGSRITVIDNEGVLHTDEVRAGDGYASQSSMRVHFGLGQAPEIDSLIIAWPGGYLQVIENLAVDNYYTVTEGELPQVLSPVATTGVPLLPEPGIDLHCYPNPFSGDLQIAFHLSNPHMGCVSIYDLSGTLHYRSEPLRWQPGQNVHMIPGNLMKSCTKGPVLVQLSGRNGTVSRILFRQ